ncbi:MAG: InlB B-repeat-containing protein, partial [Clostridia bacterium]|nr:InlB B-repeat-containing protein [Clostridia bacterium]
MRKFKKGASFLLCVLCCIFMLVFIAESGGLLRAEAVYNYNGYRTYTMGEATKLKELPNGSVTIDGTSYNTTSVQGMNVGTTYIYTAKIYSGDATYPDGSKVEAATIWRTKISDPSKHVEMTHYIENDQGEEVAVPFITAGHANDLEVSSAIEGYNHLFLATGKGTSPVARYKIYGEKLTFTGYFKFYDTNGKAVGCSAIRQFSSDSSVGYVIFLIKSGESIYYLRIYNDQKGGPADNATPIPVYKIATVDKRNGVFAKSNSSSGTYTNVETWVPQGFEYNADEKAIYTPYFEPASASDGKIMNTVIMRYYVGDVITLENMDFRTESDTLILPCKTSFYLKGSVFNSGCTTFEVESCGFRTGQDPSTGDLKMYICANAAPLTYEAIYSLSYTAGSGSNDQIKSSPVVYTVHYDANGGVQASDVKDDSNGYFKMADTRHVNGISAKLRPNKFTRDGYTFVGWHLYRASDDKWLYRRVTEVNSGTPQYTVDWYKKGSENIYSFLALYTDTQSVSALSDVDGDVITCYAQWQHNTDSTQSFYIRYAANGGTGTMEESRITYGGSDRIRANTFTREGYVFSGWKAHRWSDNKWAFKYNNGDNERWDYTYTSGSGYFLKAYTDQCTLSGTSTVNGDNITFYAAWTKVSDPVVPDIVSQGLDFSVGGWIYSNAGLYDVTLSIINSSGTVVKTKTVNPYAHSYDLSLSSSALEFKKLAVGNYTYKVTARTLNVDSYTTVTLIEQPFTVKAHTTACKVDVNRYYNGHWTNYTTDDYPDNIRFSYSYTKNTSTTPESTQSNQSDFWKDDVASYSYVNLSNITVTNSDNYYYAGYVVGSDANNAPQEISDPYTSGLLEAGGTTAQIMALPSGDPGIYTGADPQARQIVLCTETNYYITYNYNDGGTTANKRVKYHWSETVDTAQPFERNGYVFKGWVCSLNDQKYTPGQSVSRLSETAGEEITFTADWDVVRFDINYVYRGTYSVSPSDFTGFGTFDVVGTLDGVQKHSYTGADGSSIYPNIAFSGTSKKEFFTVSNIQMTTGYVLTGYYVGYGSEDPGTDPEGLITDIPDEIYIKYTENRTMQLVLYIDFAKTSVSLTPLGTIEYYQLKNTYPSNTYDYITMEGTVTGTYFEQLPAPVGEAHADPKYSDQTAGYTFMGYNQYIDGLGGSWYYGPDMQAMSTWNITDATTSIDAIWSPNVIVNASSCGTVSGGAILGMRPNTEITISGNTISATVYTFDSSTLAYNSSVVSITATPDSGGETVFNGWCFSEDLGTILEDGTITIIEPKTIVASFGYNIFNVTYHDNAEGAYVSGTPSPASSATVTNTAVLTRANCTFLGWNTAPDGSGVSFGTGGDLYRPEAPIYTKDIDLYAIWAQESCLISRGKQYMFNDNVFNAASYDLTDPNFNYGDSYADKISNYKDVPHAGELTDGEYATYAPNISGHRGPYVAWFEYDAHWTNEQLAERKTNRITVMVNLEQAYAIQYAS